MKGNWTIRQLCAAVGCVCAAVVMTVSCTGLIFDDRAGCEHGIQMNFRYDYNLQRADMLAEHVGEATVYVFDGQGKFISSQIFDFRQDSTVQAGFPEGSVVLELPAGSYRLVVLAHQDTWQDDPAAPGAQFLRTPMTEGDDISSLAVELECAGTRAGGSSLSVNHEGQPLDTVWHAMTEAPVTVGEDGYTDADISLVRNTKRITVTLRDLDSPEDTRVEDYEFEITDRNRRLLYDNSVDDTDTLLYTPFALWNTTDRGSGTGTDNGATAHADFMTSRIVYYDDPADDARLTVREKSTGRTIIDVDLPGLLSSLANYDELSQYSPQEFLDRGYDYSLSFFISGGDWAWVNVGIGVLGWSKRIQNVAL